MAAVAAAAVESSEIVADVAVAAADMAALFCIDAATDVLAVGMGGVIESVVATERKLGSSAAGGAGAAAGGTAGAGGCDGVAGGKSRLKNEGRKMVVVAVAHVRTLVVVLLAVTFAVEPYVVYVVAAVDDDADDIEVAAIQGSEEDRSVAVAVRVAAVSGTACHGCALASPSVLPALLKSARLFPPHPSLLERKQGKRDEQWKEVC